VLIGTNPLVSDSDLDSYLDGVEIMYGTDPLNPNDYPGAPTTSTTTYTTTISTSPQPDESSPLMLMIMIGGVGGIVVIIVIFSIRRKRLSS